MCNGVGTDIVSVGRIHALIRDTGDAFLQRWFTPLEIAYCTAKAVPARHFTARMAAKEAVVKAMPFGWQGPLPWRSIEIVNSPHGAPVVRLSGEMLETARKAGVSEVRVSMSHCDEFATATAVVTLAPGQRAEPAETTGAASLPLAAPAGTRRATPVERDPIEQILREWQGLRDADADPELAAVRLAILLEDTLGVTFSDDEIDLAVLSDPDAVRELLPPPGGRL